MKKIIIALTIFVAILAGCASTGWQETKVAEEDGVTVKLQKQVEKGATVEQNYNHPAGKIDTDLLTRVFRDLKYIDRSPILGRPVEKSVFQKQEIEKLAPAVAMALKRADSNSRVYFASFNYSTDTLLKKRRITEGVLFLDENKKLNIAFSWINQRVDVNGEPLLYGDRQLEAKSDARDPLETYDTAKKLAADISYIKKAEIRDGKDAPMWIKADLNVLAQTQETPEAETAGTEKQEKKTYTAEPEPDKEPEDIKEERRQEIRSRLKYLKELYEEGLITESEYENQKQQALEELQ
ncbi:MAG: SHOCT domain-containing protein [Desulfosalsimonas sp.]